MLEIIIKMASIDAQLEVFINRIASPRNLYNYTYELNVVAITVKGKEYSFNNQFPNNI